ncbi:hypothetical protein NSP_45460 [Nodularia spumigena CCY9414]|nr:hypothetical protein NSP_45460 [Nodularia spumigena CCY9414]
MVDDQSIFRFPLRFPVLALFQKCSQMLTFFSCLNPEV